MATTLNIEGVVKNVREDQGYYGAVVKVTIAGDDGNTYWFSSTAKFVWRLKTDERVVITATEKDRKPSTYKRGTDFVVVKRPKLVRSLGRDEATQVRREVETAEAIRTEAKAMGNEETVDILDGLLEKSKAKLDALSAKYEDKKLVEEALPPIDVLRGEA